MVALAILLEKKVQDVDPIPRYHEKNAHSWFYWRVSETTTMTDNEDISGTGKFGEPSQLKGMKSIEPRWIFKWNTEAPGNIVNPMLQC